LAYPCRNGFVALSAVDLAPCPLGSRDDLFADAASARHRATAAMQSGDRRHLLCHPDAESAHDTIDTDDKSDPGSGAVHHRRANLSGNTRRNQFQKRRHNLHRPVAQGQLQLRDSKMNTARTFVLIAVLACWAMPTAAQDLNRTIDQYKCRDVMRESGANRDIAIAFLHGFLLGKSGNQNFNLDVLHKQTEAFVDHCLSNPDGKAVDSMMAVKK
jgi:hypothetical protein